MTERRRAGARAFAASLAVLAAGTAAAGALRAASGPETPAAESAATAGGAGRSASDALARDMLRELVGIDTTDTPRGNVTTAAEAMARRFRAAGFADADVQVIGPSARKKNLVVRLRGSGERRPVLLMGHLDVVEARREDWSSDPFVLEEKGGFFYGRGTLDMKGPDVIMAAALLRLKREGYVPARDIVLALTADEEGGSANGVAWLLGHHRELVDAQFALNGDDYSVTLREGKPRLFRFDASEKVYADFQLQVTSSGGHSSEPVGPNAIYGLTHALERLAAFDFPFELNAVTREYYRRLAATETGERAADMRAVLAEPPDAAAVKRLVARPEDYWLTHTTCVPTRLDAGHANNALPQRATGVVNCRILPGHTPEEVRTTLVRVVADAAVGVRFLGTDGTLHDTAPQGRGFEPPPLLPEVLGPLDRLVHEFWPGLPVIPVMSPGASDAVYTIGAGIPTYTLAPLAIDPQDDREHGRDERIGVASFYQGNEFFYRYLKAVSAH